MLQPHQHALVGIARIFLVHGGMQVDRKIASLDLPEEFSS